MKQLRESLLGKALDPFSGEARKHVALVAVPGLGRSGRRRPVLRLLRSRGGVPGPRSAYAARASTWRS